MDRNLAWQEARPSRWERNVDESEQFYASLAQMWQATGRMFFAITGHVSIRCTIPDDIDQAEWQNRLDVALRSAWLVLRHDQPTIASWIEWRKAEQRLVKVYDASNLDYESILQSRWLNDTFKIIKGFRSGRHWCNSDPPAPKLPTLFVIEPADVSVEHGTRTLQRDLVIRSPHDVMDGIGTLSLLGHLLAHISAALDAGPNLRIPEFGDEWKRLSPAMPVALGLTNTRKENLEAFFNAIEAKNKSLTENVNLLTVPYKAGVLLPNVHQRIEANLSVQESKELLSACKKLGVSVTHAYHAAAAVTLSQIQPQHLSGQSARYINYALVNLRHHCETPFNTSQYAASVYHCGSPHSLAIDMTVPSAGNADNDSASAAAAAAQRAEFMRVLLHVKSFYHEIRDDQLLPQLSGLKWKATTPKCSWDDEESSSIPPPNPAPSVSISSMGIIDKLIQRQYSSLNVFNPWVTGEELGNGLGLFLGTFRDELGLSAAFNDAWHDSDEIQDFLQRCHRTVVQGLDIGK